MYKANITLFVIGLLTGFVLAGTIGIRALATEPVQVEVKKPTILGHRVGPGLQEMLVVK